MKDLERLKETLDNALDYLNLVDKGTYGNTTVIELVEARSIVENLIIQRVSNRRELLIDFCLKMEEKAMEYKHLVPSEEFIDKYIKGNL